MRLLHSISAASAAVLFCATALATPPLRADDAASACATRSAVDLYTELAREDDGALRGRRIAVEVDTDASPGLAANAEGHLGYPMFLNDVAEGWSWQPQAQPEEDYYRWKFLPLQSVSETRASYVQEEMVGVPQNTRVEWRYDYFLAFDNPRDFYARGEAGFVVPAPAGGLPAAWRLVAVLRLADGPLRESTTFWKAVHARPVDFTLKKRYFVGRLESLVVCDRDGEREPARLGRSTPPAAVQR